ncbi:MAG: TetR/AcrR family transcriptional regulator [Actinobacteria bacterium]|nr:TetR/AcrR family transcriptional regulator [Actinomycetota bacterium]
MAERADLEAVPEDLPAVDGRVPGRRGRATRDRLLQCTEEQLQKGSYRDLSVIDIAQCAGTSPATFYQYFEDVEAAILVLAGALADEAPGLRAIIEEGDWRGKGGPVAAQRLVDAILDLWERHRAVMRVVDLSTAEGDLRFRNIRVHLLNEVTESLRRVIEERQRQRRARGVDPMAQAAALVSMLVHVAAHRYGFEFWGIKTDDMRRAAAGLVYTGVTGRHAEV